MIVEGKPAAEGMLVHDRRATTADGCPRCDAPIANVQGVAACSDCRWVDDGARPPG